MEDWQKHAPIQTVYDLLEAQLARGRPQRSRSRQPMSSFLVLAPSRVSPSSQSLRTSLSTTDGNLGGGFLALALLSEEIGQGGRPPCCRTTPWTRTPESFLPITQGEDVLIIAIYCSLVCTYGNPTIRNSALSNESQAAQGGDGSRGSLGPSGTRDSCKTASLSCTNLI